MRLGSLFAGIDGFGEGFRQAGIPTVWQVEIDPACQAVLRRHFPGAALYGDIRTVSGANLEPVDIITFGSPCQSLSVAGKRAGFADKEVSGLFFEATRVIGEMREATSGRFPRFAVWENVPGAQSASNGFDFGAALDALAECGAVDIAWRTIDAQHWVPQRRRRLFVLAIFPPEADGRAGIGRAAEILALTESVRRHPAARRAAGEDIAGTLGSSTARSSSPGGGGLRLDIDGMTFVPEVAYARNGRGAPSEIVPPLKAQSGGTGKGDGAPLVMGWDPRSITSPGNRSTITPDAPSPTLHESGMAIAFKWQAGAKAGGGGEASLSPGLGVTQTPAVYALQGSGVTSQGSQGSGWKADESFTLNTTDVHGVAMNVSQAVQVRRLTPLECERLQGFEDGWTTGHSDSTRYRMLGNAVCVPVARWLGERLLMAQLQEEGQ